MSFTDQTPYALRCEWGAAGVRHLAPHANTVVIVDVLSWTTAVDIAVSRGAVVLPYRWRDATAAAYAADHRALLAMGRDASAAHPYSLSPASLTAIPAGTRLVLPSPNGSTLAFLAAERGAVVMAACVRNAAAVARAAHIRGGIIAVIPAGERWRDTPTPDDTTDDRDTLRPALEDWLGAGAVLDALAALDPAATLSPEAAAAVATFRALAADLPAVIAACASGRELTEAGDAADVVLATQLNVSTTVPLLRGGELTG